MHKEEALKIANRCLNYNNIVHYAGKSFTSEEAVEWKRQFIRYINTQYIGNMKLFSSLTIDFNRFFYNKTGW